MPSPADTGPWRAGELSLAVGNVVEFPPADIVHAAADAGFDACGVWIESERWTPAHTRETRLALAQTGLSLLDAEVLWIPPDGELDELERRLAIAGELGARHVLVVSSHPDPGQTAASLARLCELAATAGIVVGLEFLPITEVRSLPEAAAIVTAAAAANCGVLIDTLHLARTHGVTADIANAGVPLPYVQIADAPADAPGESVRALRDEAVDGRLLPGDGELPLLEWLRALPSGIAVAPEIRSAALREQYPDLAGRAAAIARASRAVLEAATG